jgi:hypothetical protein
MNRRQKWRDLLLLAGCALAVRVLTAWPLRQPGYMDAYYYYETAKSLYQRRGFSEEFLWNYLDDPQGLPHPSNLYWMPLSSLLIWPGFAVFGLSYRAAQIPFILLSALLPVVAYLVAVETTGKRRDGIIAGLLAVFSGFYLAFWVSPDAFAPFALVGSLCLMAAYKALSEGRLSWMLLAGVLAGLGHLARADGLLLLGTVLVVALIVRPKAANVPLRGTIEQENVARRPSPPAPLPFGRLRASSARERGDALPLVGGELGRGLLALLLGGYLLVMAPWFYRNWQAVGAILPTAGTKTIFLHSYDDLFSYGLDLSLPTYLAWGAGPILRSKLEAAWVNTQTVVVVLCLVFLAPFAAVGFWRLRHHLLYRLAFLYGALLWLAMTFVFTFPGVRGGLLHSGGGGVGTRRLLASSLPGRCPSWPCSSAFSSTTHVPCKAPWPTRPGIVPPSPIRRLRIGWMPTPRRERWSWSTTPRRSPTTAGGAAWPCPTPTWKRCWPSAGAMG